MIFEPRTTMKQLVHDFSRFKRFAQKSRPKSAPFHLRVQTAGKQRFARIALRTNLCEQ